MLRFASLVAVSLIAFSVSVSPSAHAQDCWRPDALEGVPWQVPVVTEGVYSGLTFHRGGPQAVEDTTDYFVVTVPPHAKLEIGFEVTSAVEVEPPYGAFFHGAFGYSQSFQFQAFLDPKMPNGPLNPPEFHNTGSTPRDVYIRIEGVLPESVGCFEYELTVDLDRRLCNVLLDDAFEGPDDCATATVLVPGAYPDLVLFGPGRRTGEDADYYRVPNVQPGETVFVDVYRYGDDPTPISVKAATDPSCSGPTGEATTFFRKRNDTGAPADVYFVLGTLSRRDYVRYGLDIRLDAPTCPGVLPDALEPNSSCDNPVVLTPGTYTGLTLEDANDFYEVQIPADHVLTARTTPTSALVVPHVGIRGTWTCGGTVSPSEDSYSSPGGPSNVYVMVRDPDGNCGTYDLELSVSPMPCTSGFVDSAEPNDTCVTAAVVPLDPAAEFTRTETFELTANDIDHFRVTVPPGDEWYEVVIEPQTPGFGLAAYPAGDCATSPLEGPLPGGFPQVRLTLPNRADVPLDHVVRVTAPPGTSDCVQYSLTFRKVATPCNDLISGAQPAPDISGNDCATAERIVPGAVRAQALIPGRKQVYELTLPAGETMTVRFPTPQQALGYGTPVLFALHDGYGDCAAGGASFGSTVVAPEVPNAVVTHTNASGSDQLVVIELRGAPGYLYCGLLDFVVDVGPARAFFSDCLPQQDGWARCPCGNRGAADRVAGCVNSTGVGATLDGAGSASVALDDFLPSAYGLPGEAPGLLVSWSQPYYRAPFGFYDGLFCLGESSQVVQGFATGIGGGWQSSTTLASLLGANPGGSAHLQVWYRDGAGPCGAGANTSNSIRIEWE